MLDLLRLTFLPSVKGDRLSIFANSYQTKAKVGFFFKLFKVEPHQGFTKHNGGDDGANQGIEHQEKHERSGNSPEHATKGNHRQHRLHQHQQKREGFLSKATNIFSNPLVWVVDVCVGTIELVIGAIAKV